MTDHTLGPPVGIVPAAGRARRLGPQPCSKEILPIGRHEAAGGGGEPRPGAKVSAHYLLERLAAAGVTTVYMVIGEGKWDIPACLGDGATDGVDLVYLTIRDSPGVPFTIDRAHAQVHDRLVVFGLPDVVFEPRDALADLVAEQRATGADVVLALFPTTQPWLADVVELGPDGRVASVAVKPTDDRPGLAWVAAVWTPTFAAFLHERLALHERLDTPPGELHLGHVLQDAVVAGLDVRGMAFPHGWWIDIGTLEGLAAARRRA